MPKKILIFSVVYYPQYVGGAEVAVKEITDRINPDQAEFHVITLRRSSLDALEDKIGNVIVHRVGFPFFSEDIVRRHFVVVTLNKIFYPLLAFSKAQKLQKKFHFDAVWSLMANYSGFAAYFFKLLYPKIPFILSLQEGDSENHLKYRWGGLIALSWKLTLSKADFLLAISNYLLERATGMGFAGRAYLVPNGVNIKHFSQEISAEEKSRLRTELGLKDGDIALVTSSRLTVKNGVGDVIKALSTLPQNVKFVVLGTGELERELKNLSKKLDVPKRVIFNGFVQNLNLYKYLKACDIFIRPSLSEGMGNSFIEAMAARVPVIATPVGGIVDFLLDEFRAGEASSAGMGRTGYFCQPSDPKSISEAVNRVISDPDKKLVLENAFEMVRQKYDWDHIAKDVREKIVEKI